MMLFFHFQDLYSEKASSSAIPDNYRPLVIRGDKKVFETIQMYLKEYPGTEHLIICAGPVPSWSKETWNRFNELGKMNSATKCTFDKLSLTAASGISPYIAFINTSDLRMALDQNYRPNFEDLCEALSTFGFSIERFSPENVLN